MALGVIYCLASVAWPIALGVSFCGYRTAAGIAEVRIRDAMILDLRCEIRDLRRRIAAVPHPRGTD